MNATNYGRARIAALIQFLEQQGYSPNHIAAHVRTEWSNHATAENSPEEFLALVHYYHLTRRTTSSHSLARYKVGIDPKSTLDNVILHWYT